MHIYGNASIDLIQYFAIDLTQIYKMKCDVLYLCKKNQKVSDEKITGKQRKLKIAKLMAEVESGIPSKVSTALDSLKIYGDESIIAPLFHAIDAQKDEKGVSEIIEFLSSLKNSKAREQVMECLNNPIFIDKRVNILSTIWNSPLDYSEYLPEFISLAANGDFLITLECLTILENLEGPFEEADLLEAQLILKEYHENGVKDPQKDHLMSEIALLLKDTDRIAD